MRRRPSRSTVTTKEVTKMGLTRKDAAATALTSLVVLVFVATYQSWGVPLVGDSHRWAAGAIVLLGAATCALGSPARMGSSNLPALLGTLALVLSVTAVATGSFTALSLLVADSVALWAVSTVRHVRPVPQGPVTA
jgi:hypothetical protein